MKFSVILITLFFTNFVFATDRAVIQQMKGRRAIVQFEKDIPFSVGQKIYLNSDDGTEFGVRSDTRNPMERKNSISLSASFASLDTKPATNSYSISGRYGWNMQQYEFGPLGTFEFSKRGSVSSSEISGYQFGGFFDFNLIPNKPGEDFIYGGYAEGAIGNAKVSTSSRNLTTFTAGGFLKWFFFSPMLAVRINAYYSNETQDSTSLNTMGLSFGMDHYF